MAYTTSLASVAPDEIERVGTDFRHVMTSSRRELVSHYLAYSISVQPLGELLGQIIDGGAVLHPKLWHPLRAPIFHARQDVPGLLAELQEHWGASRRSQEIADDWHAMEVSKVIAVLAHATAACEAVVNVIHPPHDWARAHRVRMPLAGAWTQQSTIGAWWREFLAAVGIQRRF